MIYLDSKLWIPLINLNPGYTVSQTLAMEYASYQVNGNIVMFKGEIIRSNALNEIVFVLPPEITPKKTLTFIVNSGGFIHTNGNGYLRFNKNGNVQLFPFSSTLNRYVRIAKIMYLLE